MEEREMKGEFEDEVMKEEREMRENEGCWVHWKLPIQLKQDCWIENSKMMERSEGRKEWRRARIIRLEDDIFTVIKLLIG